MKDAENDNSNNVKMAEHGDYIADNYGNAVTHPSGGLPYQCCIQVSCDCGVVVEGGK